MEYKKRNIEKIAFVILLLFLQIRCSYFDKPTAIQHNIIDSGKRDYSWTVDTLYNSNSGQTIIMDMWGSSSSNIFAVGHDASAGDGVMWHYDGSRWDKVNLLLALGGKIPGPFQLTAIYGFDSVTIYAVGERIYQKVTSNNTVVTDSSFVIHFDGISWKEIQLPKRLRRLTSIHGSSSTNIWIGETFGRTYHYDGNRWSIDSSALKYLYAENTPIIDIVTNTENTFATSASYKIDGSDLSFHLLSFEDNSWKIVDSVSAGVSTTMYKWGVKFLSIEGPKELLSCGYGGIFQFRKGGWDKKHNSLYPLGQMSGTRKEHIFAVGFNKSVIHYNGIDWKSIDIPGNPQWSLSGVWCTEQEVFISTDENGKSYIYKGK